MAILQGRYENAGSPPGLNPVTWAKRKLAEQTVSLSTDIVAIGNLRTAFEAVKIYPQKLEARRNAIETAQAAADAADQAQLVVLTAAGHGVGDKLELLMAGYVYLHSHPDVEECPLCASAENINGLGAAIKTRLGQLEALKVATEELRKCSTALSNMKAALQQTETEYAGAIATFAAARATHTWKAEVGLPASAAPNDPTLLQAWLDDNGAHAEAWATVEATWRDESQSRHC